MDIRQQMKNVDHLKQIKNITNAVVYNLSKKKNLYKEIYTQFYSQVLVKFEGKASFVIYGYRPLIYAACAGAYHLYSQKLGLTTFLIHVGIGVLLNQFDMVNGMKKTNPEKWQEYNEAKKNYQLALSLQKISLLDHMKSVLADKLDKQDYLRILKNRPY